LSRLTSSILSYTIYAFFEWSLIIYDIAFDAVTSIDFERFGIKITSKTLSEKSQSPFV
jgi:hypothetical protein